MKQQVISSASAFHVSVIAGKSEVDPMVFLSGKNRTIHFGATCPWVPKNAIFDLAFLVLIGFLWDLQIIWAGIKYRISSKYSTVFRENRFPPPPKPVCGGNFSHEAVTLKLGQGHQI